MIFCDHCKLRKQGCPLDPPHNATFCVEVRPQSTLINEALQIDVAAQIRRAKTRKESIPRWRLLGRLIEEHGSE